MVPPNEPEPGPGVLLDLIRAARAGSTQALGRVLEICRPYLLVIAGEELDENLQGKVGASDLVQDTFVKANAEFPGFAGESRQELLGWLRKILRNHLANLREQYQQTQKRQLSREISLERDTPEQALDGLVDPAATPERQAIAGEERATLERALAELPEHYAEVVRLRHLETLSFVVIGTRLGCSAAAARKTWVRALRQLQGVLKRRPP